jgi:hypothetical protein
VRGATRGALGGRDRFQLLPGWVLPGLLRRSALLRRLFARLKLGDEEGRQRDPGARPPGDVRRIGCQPSRSAVSPAGEPVYADFDGGTIRGIQFLSANQPPVAVATANPISGAGPRWSPSTEAARAIPTEIRSRTPGISTATASTTTRRQSSQRTRTPRGRATPRGSGSPTGAAPRASAFRSSSPSATPRPQRRLALCLTA